MNRKARRSRAKQLSSKGGQAASLSAADRHRRAGRHKDTLALYRAVLEQDPDNPDALKNLTRMSLELGQVEAAASMVLRALTSSPEEPESLEILENVLVGLDDSNAQAQVYLEYSKCLKDKDMWDRALVNHRRALRLNPALAASDTFESISLLANGDLEKGWLTFEWRNTVGSLGPFTDRVWNGEDLAGKTILVWGEQGIGDQIMFSTCLPDLIERAGQVIVAVDERLASLFSRTFPDAAVHGATRFTASGETRVNNFDWLEDYPPIDFFVLEGSLPRFFRPTINSFPDAPTKLLSQPNRVTHWRHQLDGIGHGNKIGICWRSLLMSDDRANYYPALDLWQPVFESPGLNFVNLQAGMTDEEACVLKERFGIDLHVLEGLDLVEDLDEVAALITALDGVVTTLGAVQWLAAGLGSPVWSLARGNRKSQWAFLGEKHYPWFPELKICFEEDDELLRQGFCTVAREMSPP